ncbi:MAG TPA: hypothetical protein VF794_23440 [Archangium sp.]|jgi:hypothetical protein|uniref:hypothetical protein n=1 Tax=Archangium sp. TaxID=1872627 RepID=UPI002ED7D86C
MKKNKVKIHSSTETRLEVGRSTVLTASGYNGQVTWKVDHEHLLSLKNPHSFKCEAEGIGFGKVTLTVTDKDGDSEPFTLYVGSVIIAAADHQYWQLTSDGAVTSLTLPEKDNPVVNLVNANAIVADLTPMPTSDAVTCYVLNLKSFTLK